MVEVFSDDDLIAMRDRYDMSYAEIADEIGDTRQEVRARIAHIPAPWWAHPAQLPGQFALPGDRASAADVRAVKEYYGITFGILADILGANDRTVVRWAKGEQEVSRCATMIIKLLMLGANGLGAVDVFTHLLEWADASAEASEEVL